MEPKLIDGYRLARREDLCQVAARNVLGQEVYDQAVVTLGVVQGLVIHQVGVVQL